MVGPQGYVTLREFKSGVPPLGPNGEAAKEYIFGRVDSVVDGDGKLDPQVRTRRPRHVSMARSTFAGIGRVAIWVGLGCGVTSLLGGSCAAGNTGRLRGGRCW